ncbi:unnamed protein product [Bursaphelenchus xylophilus]|uniref:(pine wood nematode) hypothetical protein n=1 Tax=Bursaphelenchus xylophilus TaxID=6326 RepID=A0A1I7SAP2_BURXY|nr:unnamed protein product [Bursaphelenchus xylophilus]CAG9126926.1 unnamed protein product [Bursaphelenchus xylophilus]
MRCEPFIYRGQKGNQNNFLSQEECSERCINSGTHIVSAPHEPQRFENPCSTGFPLVSAQNEILQCMESRPCPPGYFCHVGSNDIETVCSDPCGQPLDSGTGGARLQRWFWNAQAGCCQPFNYCGLRGTQNNFLTREDCEQTCMVINPCKLPVPLPLEQCVPGPNACAARPNMYCHVGAVPQTTVCCPAETPNPCELPVDPGAGRDRLERWFYNAQTSICQPFTYNGIKGNQNNFLSQQDCEELCVPNPCAEGRPFVGADGRPQTCSPSASMNTCPANHWCHVGATQLTTVCCPAARPNPCTLPMSTGEGDASLERFYFDQSTKTCKPFEYRGLKGNQNNFLSQRACQLACQPLDNPCIGQPATTPTGQVLFCSSTNKDTCPVNFWCHLGATPETTVCCPGATNPCSVPLAPGTGNSGLSRWYYNTDERQCVPFQYNGKRGNQNNFLSQNECERTCPEQLCLLSIDKGACSGRQTRFAFNRQTSQCVPFEYTGCGGNLNNFLTMEDCVATCGNVGF